MTEKNGQADAGHVFSLDVPSSPIQNIPLKRVKDEFNGFDELRKRWDDRLTVNNLALSKRYLESKLRILWETPYRSQGDSIKLRTIIQGELNICGAQEEGKGICQTYCATERWNGHRAECYADRSVSGPYRNDRLVLIQDVQLMKAPERFIPSLVWFQIVDERDCFGGSSLYVFREAGFKFCFGVPDNKVDMLKALPSGVAMTHDSGHQEIKGCPGIVNHIADYRSQMLRDAMIDFQLPDSLASLRVVLGEDAVRVSGLERFNFCGKLPDVGFGPFSL